MALAQRSETRGGNTARSHRQVRRRRARDHRYPLYAPFDIDELAARIAAVPSRQDLAKGPDPRGDLLEQLWRLVCVLRVHGQGRGPGFVWSWRLMAKAMGYDPDVSSLRSLQRYAALLEEAGLLRTHHVRRPNGSSRGLGIELLEAPPVAHMRRGRAWRWELRALDDAERRSRAAGAPTAGRLALRRYRRAFRAKCVPIGATPLSSPSSGMKAVASGRAKPLPTGVRTYESGRSSVGTRDCSAVLGAAVSAARQRMWTAAGEEEAQALLATARRTGTTLAVLVELVGLRRPDLLLGLHGDSRSLEICERAAQRLDREGGLGAGAGVLDQRLRLDLASEPGEQQLMTVGGYAIHLRQTGRAWRAARRTRQGNPPPDRRAPYAEGRPPRRSPWPWPPDASPWRTW